MGFIKNYKKLNTSPQRKIVLELIESALESIQPEHVFKTHFKLERSVLKILDQTYNLDDYERVFLLGFGKGSANNCSIVESILGNTLTAGHCIDVTDQKFSKIKFTKGTHPVTSQTNIDFTKNVLNQLSGLTAKDLVLIITCGGGSALLELPTIPLEKKMAVDSALLKANANIHDMNVVRKHLSKVKGGDLAKVIYPAKVVNLIFSDVPGNDLTTIASGPTVADPTTQEDAWNVYQKYKLADKVPLKKDDFTQTESNPKIFENVDNILFLSNLTALNAIKQKAKSLNIDCQIFSDHFQSEAINAGIELIKKTKNKQILLAGGETTVNVKGGGIGGRNQELVLSALKNGVGDTVIVSFDSDGWDNCEFAGAIGDTTTLKKAQDLNLDMQTFLNSNNTYNFFKKVGDGLETGRLPSNVSDLMIVYKN